MDYPVPGVQIVERGRKIHEEKKRGETKVGKGTPVNISLQSSFRPSLTADRVTVTLTTAGLNCEIKC